ncbi:MAG: peptide deformylase [Bacteroidaceae bacterium]
MILPISIYGLPILRKVAEEITPDYPELNTLIDNMYETLDKSDGVGLAAPQVGLSVRLVVVDLDVLSDDFPEYKGFRRIYMNGHILETNDEIKSMDEGCLSLPGISEPVKRPTRIRVQYVDADFKAHDEWVDSYLARVLQHEFDHLEGKMFIDRLAPLRKTMIKGKLTSFLKGKVHCSYKFKCLK